MTTMVPQYESMLEAVYRAALRPGDIAIDIGAHVGRHTLPIARAVGPAGKVFAFEPLPAAYAELRRKVENAQGSGGELAAIITHNVALGEEEGEAKFVFVPDFPEYSGFRERTYHDDSLRRETIDVRVLRLDSYRAEFGTVRFVKIDAEGGELTILRGGVTLIGESVPIVSFELGNGSLTNYPYTAADYFDFFAELGYTLFSIFGIPLSRDEFISAADEQFFWDYIAVPGRSPWPFGHDHLRVLVGQLGEASVTPGIIPESEAGTGRDALLAAAQAAETRAMAAEARVAALCVSTSWRMTAPLRRLADLFKKKRCPRNSGND